MSEYRTISITEILQTVQESCDFGYITEYPGQDDDERRTYLWNDIIRVKSADSGFGHLVHRILDEGFTTAIGWDDYEKTITEGHHRLVAAILLGMDEIPYTHGGINNWGGLFSAHCNNVDPFPIPVEVL